MKNTVTIIMAAHNGEVFIGQQIQSILEQTYANWELIIRDDGSDDDTVNIAKSYAEKEKRIEVIQGEPSGGAKGNFASLIGLAHDRDYIMFCDQDDYWRRDKLEIMMDKMAECEQDKCDSPLLIYSGKELTDSDLKPLSIRERDYDDTLEAILLKNHIYGCTMLLNAPLIRMVADFPDYVQMHDYYVALNAAYYGQIVRVPQKLVMYRQHDNNETGGINNFSLSSKLKSFGKINRKLHEVMTQNYCFCKTVSDECREAQKYLEILNSGRIARVVKECRSGIRMNSKLGTLRYLYALLTWDRATVKDYGFSC